MEEVVLNPKYYSSIFECTLVTDKGKDEKPVHFLPGPKGFSIHSLHWDQELYNIKIDQINSVTMKQKFVTISCDNKVTIKLKCEKGNKIVEALQINDNNNNNLDVAISHILPQLSLEMNDITELNQELIKIASSVLSTLDSTISMSKELVSLLACVYRVRFPKGDWKKNAQSLKREFYLYFLLFMINSLEKLSQLKSDREYLIRIVSNSGNTISLLSDALRINVKQLLGSCANYCEGGSVAGIYNETKKVKTMILEIFNNERTNDIDQQKFVLIDKMYLISIAGFCGKLVDIYEFEIKRLTNLTIDILASIRLGKTVNIQELNYGLKLFEGNMIKCCNEKRYEPQFQFVFAMWAMVGNEA